ncbi:hypothetical protein ASPCAL02425 [Aspergillus calidoustus]|uniref:LysM domain-containing protein n=1 Tax=Aspergillus calidoustus TaxID=454130 RepID=A0A0U5GPS1_ASPCI|nr:hypothetical protein ASPCAL02425 [Aspergillus calidoustus]
MFIPHAQRPSTTMSSRIPIGYRGTLTNSSSEQGSSDGQFCTSYLWAHDSPDSACDECILRVAQRQVNSPFGVDEGVQENYASLTSECQASGHPTSTATSLVISSPIATPRTCSGTLYTIQPNDDFFSIPRSQSVSTENLLHSNGLGYVQDEFPTTATLCIENQCTLHLLAADDTCASIEASAGISQV